MDKILLGVGFVLLTALILWAGPALAIWAVNTVFGLKIVMTFKVWFATLVLLMLVNSGRTSVNKSK